MTFPTSFYRILFVLGTSSLVAGSAMAQTLQAGVKARLQAGTQENAFQAKVNVQGMMGRIMILFDLSSSMDEQFFQRGKTVTKLAAAKGVMGKVLPKIPVETQVGLRTFASDIFCSLVSSRVAAATGNRGALQRRVDSFQSGGKTPLAAAIAETGAQDFEGARDLPKKIILVSDGSETCGGDPCAAALELRHKNISLSIDVIGYDIHDSQVRQQLECIAHATRGQYRDARSEQELEASFGQALQFKKKVQGTVILPGKAASEPAASESSATPSPSLSPNLPPLVGLPPLDPASSGTEGHSSP